MNTASDSGVVELAGFLLEVARRRLTAPDGTPVALKPKVFDTLAYLAARPGEVVDKREILAAVWPGVVVEENSLNQAISLLRKALGDSREQPRIIATIPGRGYQLVVPVQRVEGVGVGRVGHGDTESGTASTAANQRAYRVFGFALMGVVVVGAVATAYFMFGAAAPLSADGVESAAIESGRTAGVASLAVLPFTDMSEGQTQGYFADGLTDELMSQLSTVDGLRIAGRTSVYAWKARREDLRAAGRVLGVAYVLEGSVRRQGDQLRITAQLASTDDGYQVWSQTYERRAGDVFAIQQDIARAVAAALPAELGAGDGGVTVARQKTDPDTYDLYLRGNARLQAGGAENLARAEELFREAMARDAKFLPSQIGLAQTLSTLPAFQPQRAASALAEADALITRMIEVAPEVADVHAMRAARLLFLQRDLLGARRALDEGIRAAPRAQAQVLAASWLWGLRSITGSVSAAVQPARDQARADPLSLAASASLQQILYAAGRTSEAEAEYLRSHDLQGDRARVETAALLRAVEQKLDDAVIRERSARLRDALAPTVRSVMLDPSTGLDDPRNTLDQLRRELARAPDPGALSPQVIAQWAAHFGDTELALEALRVSFRFAGPAATSAWEPALKRVRASDGFRELLRQQGFEAYWRATGEWGDYCRPTGDRDFACQ